MRVIDMIEAVRMGIDKTAGYDQSVSFEENEVLYWLNEAQLELVKQKMFGNNYRRETYDTLHEGHITKRSDDLSNLIRYSNKLPYSVNNTYPKFRPHDYHPNIAVVNITPTTVPHYLFYIGADFKVVGKDAPMETVVIEQKNIGDFVETPTNKPYLRNGFVYLKEGEVNVIYDPYTTPEWLYISYVMQPKTLALYTDVANWITDYSHKEHWDDEELSKGLISEQVHPEIVALAVNLMLENVADPRYKTHLIELNKKE